MPDRSLPAGERVAHNADELLRLLAEGIASDTGEAFFCALVRNLATLLGARHAFLAEFAGGPRRVRTLACWSAGALVENFEFDLAGTPCEEVVGGKVGHHESGLQALFPADASLVDWHAESYLGVPLLAMDGAVLGHLAVIDDRPMPAEPAVAHVMELFAVRARVELERLRAESALRESEQRYRDLYDEAPNAYVSTGTDGRLIRGNRAARELFGYSAEEFAGLPVMNIMADTPAGKPAAREVFERFLAGLETRNRQLQCVRSDGTHVWVNLTVRPLRDAAGKVVASRSILVDITERKAIEDALRASEERLSRVLDGAMDAIVVIDGGMRIVLFNHAAERTFRCSAADARSRSLEGFLTAELRDVILRSLDDLAGGGAARSQWLPHGLSARRADGQTFPIEATVSQVTAGGEPLTTLILRDINDRMEAERALRESNLHRDYLLEEIKANADFEEIIGRSAGLRELLRNVELVAPTDTAVLVVGETGTGKELIARAIHAHGGRRDKPLIKVNCAALPTGLVESELFGHERGAFTGAVSQRIGRFELADGGTIFLDEIGELPPDVQVKLLRVLQEQELERVGGTATIRLDVRLIAATNRDLEAAVADGSFRSDLFYRLSVFPLAMPPLRDRPEDIPLLVHYFAQRAAARIGRKLQEIDGDSMRRLTAYAWPGNVRELANVIERAVIIARDGRLEVPPGLLPDVPAPPATSTLRDVERAHIETTLERAGWVIEGPRGAARVLNLHPNTLRSRMKKLGIARPR